MKHIKKILILILAAVFIAFRVDAESPHVVISEVLIQGSNEEEFVKLYNDSDSDISLKGWHFNYYSSSRNWDNPYRFKQFPEDAKIKANDYFVIGLKGYGTDVSDWQPYTSDQLSNTKGSVAIFSSNQFSKELAVDAVGWGEVDFVKEQKEANLPAKGKSILRTGNKDSGDNSKDFKESGSNSEEENKQEQDSKEEKIFSKEIIINEIFPYPDSSEEYVEIFNKSEKDQDLLGWILKDASKTGKYEFIDHVTIKTKEYLAIYKNEFKFALNNSGKETVTLLDPNANEVSKMDYNGAKKDLSYSFDGEKWRWTKYLTPNEENKFEDLPNGKVRKDKNVYVGIFANFEIKKLSKKAKVVWDFGDGHKSYLAKTKHKYISSGKYNASVKYNEGSEDVVENFEVNVKKYPKQNIDIIAVNANPKGKDTGAESITLENKTSKKINLKNWSIATGWKKLLNHPVSEDFEIAAGKTKEITHAFSKFTLNNKQAKIELRYPNGKVVDKIKYESSAIKDGEIYEKVNGKWIWKQALGFRNQLISSDTIPNQQKNYKSEVNEASVLDNQAKQTVIERENKLNKIEVSLIEEKVGMVLGGETVKEIDGQYVFTVGKETEYYGITFFNNIFIGLNKTINSIVGFFN